MKFKHVVASLGLSMFTAFGLAAGFGMSKEAKAVKADEPDTWMVRFQLDLGECSPHYDPCCFPEEKPVEGVKFHYWGTNVNETVQASYMYDSFTFAYYGVNVCLNDSQTINGAQWVLEQKDEGLKYSVNITKFGSEEVTSLNKDTTLFGLQHQFANIWEGDHWKFSNEVGHKTDSIKIDAGVDEHSYYDFVKEPSLGRFSCKNLTFDKVTGMSLIVDELSSFSIDDDTRGMMDEESLQYADGDQPNWWWNAAGTFDYFLYDDTFQIRKYGLEESYIYYVTQSGEESPDYIYTFGNDEQYGSWPGTKISQIVDVTSYFSGNADFKYHGSDGNTFNRVVYKIPVEVGYPADTKVIFHNNNGAQTDDLDLFKGHAYFWTNSDSGWSTDNDAKALDVIVKAEAFRAGAEDASVCNISKSDAIEVYTEYLALSAYQKGLVDGSAVYTYSDEEKQSSTYKDVSYGKVMERIGIIAELVADPSSAYNFFDLSTSSSTTIIIVIAVSASSVLAFTLLLVFKKKKRN